MNPFKHSAQTFFRRIGKYIINHRKYIFATAINLTALFIISMALQSSGVFEIIRFIDIRLFAWAVIVVDIIALRLHQIRTKNATFKHIFEYGFFILLTLQLIKGYLTIELIGVLDTSIVVLTIMLGALIVYDNRNIINEIEKECEQEKIEERRRKNEFAQK